VAGSETARQLTRVISRKNNRRRPSIQESEFTHFGDAVDEANDHWQEHSQVLALPPKITGAGACIAVPFLYAQVLNDSPAGHEVAGAVYSWMRFEPAHRNSEEGSTHRRSGGECNRKGRVLNSQFGLVPAHPQSLAAAKGSKAFFQFGQIAIQLVPIEPSSSSRSNGFGQGDPAPGGRHWLTLI